MDRQKLGKLATMSQAHADHGTLLKPSESALVVDEEGKIRFLLPAYNPDHDVPKLVELLAAVFIKSPDDDWVSEMISVFESEQ